MPPPTLPWVEEAAFTRLLLHDVNFKSSFHKTDIWHNLQLGRGKAFCSSALVTMLPLFEGNNVEDKFRAITDAYKSFCKDPWPHFHQQPNLYKFIPYGYTGPDSLDCVPCYPLQAKEMKVCPYLQKISKDTLGYKSSKDPPEAHWSRGEVTTTLLRFIETVLERKQALNRGKEVFELIVPCQIGAFFQGPVVCKGSGKVWLQLCYFLSNPGGCVVQVHKSVPVAFVALGCLVNA